MEQESHARGAIPHTARVEQEKEAASAKELTNVP